MTCNMICDITCSMTYNMTCNTTCSMTCNMACNLTYNIACNMSYNLMYNMTCKFVGFLQHMKYSFQTTDNLCFVTEYLGGGELHRLVHKVGHLSENNTRFYSSEVIAAIGFLHQCNVVYRDLKVFHGACLIHSFRIFL